MPLTVATLYAPGLKSQARPLQSVLETLFPGLRSGGLFEAALPRAAYDTARGWYDAPFLLARAMPATPSCALALWLINAPLGDSRHPWLLGAAVSGKAVVSAARLTSPQALAKVAAHEIGHLLGLAHCRSRCLMRVAPDEDRLTPLPLSLCAACQKRLASHACLDQHYVEKADAPARGENPRGK